MMLVMMFMTTMTRLTVMIMMVIIIAILMEINQYYYYFLNVILSVKQMIRIVSLAVNTRRGFKDPSLLWHITSWCVHVL